MNTTTTTIINYNDVILGEDRWERNIIARVWDINGEQIIFDCNEHKGYTTVNRNAVAIAGDISYNEDYMFAIAGSPRVGEHNEYESTYVDALLYAGVRGNTEAMREFNLLVDAGKVSAQEQLADRPTVNNGTNVSLDGLYLVHTTKYDINELIDDEGNIILRPSGDYKNMVEWSDRGVGYFQRHTLHFTVNHAVVTAKMNGFTVGEWEDGTSIIVPLQAVLDANPGTLESLSANDTWFVPYVGEGLVIPAGTYHLIEKESANRFIVEELGAERFYSRDGGAYSCEKSTAKIREVAESHGFKRRGLHYDNPESSFERRLFSAVEAPGPTSVGFYEININTGARIFSTASWRGLGAQWKDDNRRI